MIHAFLLSLAQLGDRRILSVLAKSLGLTLVVFAVFGGVTFLALSAWLAGWTKGNAFAGFIAFVVTGLAMWLLFRAIAVAVVGIFADDIVAAVEARHFPGVEARHVPFATSARMSVRAAVRAVAVNLLMLPVLLILLPAGGVGTPILFLAVNGWLLGRDLGDMVAIRHLDRADLPGWRRGTKGRRFVLGVGNAALFLIPVVNLLAPVLGAAMATHLFHRSRV